MAGYVYLIGNPIFHWYKIGKSKSPDIRVRDLGVLLPFKIKVFAIWKAENHHLMEQTLHEIHAVNRINGEWFEFDGSEIGRLINSIPTETRVFFESLDSFSNVYKDTKGKRRVIGVRTEKLRGNFTPEEREAKKLAAIEKQRQKKLAAAAK